MGWGHRAVLPDLGCRSGIRDLEFFVWGPDSGVVIWSGFQMVFCFSMLCSLFQLEIGLASLFSCPLSFSLSLPCSFSLSFRVLTLCFLFLWAWVVSAGLCVPIPITREIGLRSSSCATAAVNRVVDASLGASLSSGIMSGLYGWMPTASHADLTSSGVNARR